MRKEGEHKEYKIQMFKDESINSVKKNRIIC